MRQDLPACRYSGSTWYAMTLCTCTLSFHCQLSINLSQLLGAAGLHQSFFASDFLHRTVWEHTHLKRIHLDGAQYSSQGVVFWAPGNHLQESIHALSFSDSLERNVQVNFVRFG